MENFIFLWSETFLKFLRLIVIVYEICPQSVCYFWSTFFLFFQVNNKSYPKLFKKDPAADALHLLVTLSANAECQASILSNICLPNFSSKCF